MTTSHSDDPSLTALKSELRSAIRAKRRAISAVASLTKSQAAAERFFTTFIEPAVLTQPDLIVAGFWPSKYEIKVDLLLKLLAQKTIQTCLPEVVAHGQALIFRDWRFGDPLILGNGAEIPLPTAKIVIPNFVIVPLIGFDRQGGRLGQGGGLYDRSLFALRRDRAVTAVAIAYAEQEIAAVPRGQFDQPIDAIVTDREVIYPNHKVI
ncbi:MAG: 5-formyltetrahydrofolate cyclo-ligase [Candidatus Pacebacteria bacterium]|nr:5-formyltetrahydrofolate cyclo-ligase [Candidatus Paceibacterota bacterium]